ncbi:MAG: hypothetical protein V7L20_10885 [Nostoc sp.]
MQLITSLDIRNAKYLSKNRLISYHHQLRLIFSLGNQVKNVLEIRIFNSLLTNILKNKPTVKIRSREIRITKWGQTMLTKGAIA